MLLTQGSLLESMVGYKSPRLGTQHQPELLKNSRKGLYHDTVLGELDAGDSASYAATMASNNILHPSYHSHQNAIEMQVSGAAVQGCVEPGNLINKLQGRDLQQILWSSTCQLIWGSVPSSSAGEKGGDPCQNEHIWPRVQVHPVKSVEPLGQPGKSCARELALPPCSKR